MLQTFWNFSKVENFESIKQFTKYEQPIIIILNITYNEDLILISRVLRIVYPAIAFKRNYDNNYI